MENLKISTTPTPPDPGGESGSESLKILACNMLLV
jgi:hypothetical protein